MSTEDRHLPEMEAVMAQWMDQTAQAWSKLLKTPQAAPRPKTDSEESHPSGDKEDAGRLQWEAFSQNWRSFLESFSVPDWKSTMAASESIPPAAAKMMESSWRLFAGLEESWVEQFGRNEDLRHFADRLYPDEEAIHKWSQFYDKEIRRYLTVPQIGLNKFSQENFNNMLDRFNARQLALMEFFDLLFRPVREGAARMQEQINHWLNDRCFPDDPKTIYREWLKFVEGRYMTLFRSSEFIQSLQKTVTATLEFHSARKEVLEELARDLSIPTSRDLDDVYREMHNLKQQVRTMESQLYECTAQAASAR